ncbi:unnamed protein product [Arctogadus glacialis]
MQINPDWPEVYRTALLNITATSNAEHVDKLMTEIELTTAEVDAIKTAQNNIKDKPSAPPMEPVRAPHTMKNPLQHPGEYNHY